MGHPTMQENDTAKLTPTLYSKYLVNSQMKKELSFVLRNLNYQ